MSSYGEYFLQLSEIMSCRQISSERPSEQKQCDCSNRVQDQESGVQICTDCGTEYEPELSYMSDKDIFPSLYNHSRNNFLKYLLSAQGRRVDSLSPNKIQAFSKYLQENELDYSFFRLYQFFSEKRWFAEFGRLNDYHCYFSQERLPRISNLYQYHILQHYDMVFNAFFTIETRRKNLLEHSYILFKILELNGSRDLGETLIVYQNKFRTNDRIWTKICEYLNWTYYPTTQW